MEKRRESEKTMELITTDMTAEDQQLFSILSHVMNLKQVTFKMYSTEGLHRRPATSKYDQVFGDNSANTRPKDDEIRLLESLLNQRSNLPKPKNSSGFIDGLFGLIPVVILAMIMLFFLFAVLTVIKAFMATQGNDGNASH